MDYLAFSFLLYNDLQTGSYDSLFSKLALAERLAQSSKPHVSVNYSLVLFYKLQACVKYEMHSAVLETAINLRDNIEIYKTESSQILTTETLDKLAQSAKDYINMYTPKERAYNPFKEFGRNTKITVKYSDGSVITDKFKKLQRDLVLGRCQIMSVYE